MVMMLMLMIDDMKTMIDINGHDVDNSCKITITLIILSNYHYGFVLFVGYLIYYVVHLSMNFPDDGDNS